MCVCVSLKKVFTGLRISTVCVCVCVLQTFHLHPLTIVLPSKEDKDDPVVDLDLHLPFLCLQPPQLLQVWDDPAVPPPSACG